MSKARPQVLSLNGGEVDRETIARSDLESYANKAQIVENALPAIKGGLFRAPGTRFLGRTIGDEPAIVRTWRFSRRQAFTLELTQEQMRILYGLGYVQVGGGDATFGAWADGSSVGGGTNPAAPTWPPPPPPPAPYYSQGRNKFVDNR